jgi:CHAD domain-containing protein
MDSKQYAVGALNRNAGRVGARLAAYLLDPEDEKNVHDVRTSLRRLEAAFSLMPKKTRRKNRAQIRAYKEFFRANSRVRDYDIIRARLMVGDALAAGGIERKRKSALKRALELARKVQELPALDTRVDDKKLDARVGKVAGRLLNSIKERLPVALADAREKEELHELRKDLKKLRYMLEMLPAGFKRGQKERLAKEIRAGGGPVEARLKELQDLIGVIHDCDITIDYLKSTRKGGAILQKQRAERDALYEKFVKTFS